MLIGFVVLFCAACNSTNVRQPEKAALNQVERWTGLRTDLGWSVQEVLLSDDGRCAAVDLVADNGMEAGVNVAKFDTHHWEGVVGTAGVGHVAAYRMGLLDFGEDCGLVPG